MLPLLASPKIAPGGKAGCIDIGIGQLNTLDIRILRIAEDTYFRGCAVVVKTAYGMAVAVHIASEYIAVPYPLFSGSLPISSGGIVKLMSSIIL